MVLDLDEIRRRAEAGGHHVHVMNACCKSAQDVPALVAEVERLRTALGEAIEDVESWAAYAPDYFREKHDLAGDLARLREALGAGRE